MVEAEVYEGKRRTGRRLALVAIAIATLFTATFCGTGSVVNAQRSKERKRWLEFVMLQAESDCCMGPTLTGPCQAAPGVLEEVQAMARAHPTAAERFAARLKDLMGFEPMLFEVPLPAPADVDEALGRCRAAAGRVAEADTFDVGRLARAGDLLCSSEAERGLVARALGATDFRVAWSALEGLFDAQRSLHSGLAGAARVPTSGGELLPGAESTLHSFILCHRALAPLVDIARATTRTHERALLERVAAIDGTTAGDGERAAVWALTMGAVDDTAALAAAANALLALPAAGPGAHEPFLEQAVGLALARVAPPAGDGTAVSSLSSTMGPALASPGTVDGAAPAMPDDPRVLRVARALTRVAAARPDACRVLADAVVANGRQIHDDGWRDAYTMNHMPPVCDVAAAHLLASLPFDDSALSQQVRGWGDGHVVSSLPAFGLGGMQAFAARTERLDTPPFTRSTLGAVLDATVNALHVARVGVSPLVAGHPQAMRGVQAPGVTMGPCPGVPQRSCVTAVAHTPDSLVLVDAAR